MKKLVIGGVAAVAVAAIIVACGGGGGQSVTTVTSGTVISHVTIVNTQDGTELNNAAVWINNGLIQKIDNAANIQAAGSAQLVDATGQYLVPGFLDMHTHASNSLSLPPTDFPVLLANGITGIREASGAPALIQAIHQQNAAVLAGQVAAPEVLIMPSTIFAGQAATAADAIAFVKARKAEGADYLKLVAGGPVAVMAILNEVPNEGFYVAGHLVLSISALDSSNAGWRSMEHLGAGTGLILDCSPDQANIRAAMLANPAPPAPNVINPRVYDGNAYGQYYQRIINTYSDAQCQSLAQTFVKNGTWQPVTLIRLRTQDYGDDPAYVNDPNLIYVDKTRRALWAQTGQLFTTTITPATRATLQQYYALQLKVVKMMQQNGVKILAGSDLGGGWVVPGFSLHQEFHELAAAGLTPLQVLQSTTLNGAQFVGRTATMGTVDQGKNADLVLLTADPMVDSANLDKVSAVFLKGKYYSRSALDTLLSNVAAAYASMPLMPLSTALDPTHNDGE